MSLERFTNRDILRSIHSPQIGQTLTDIDLQHVKNQLYTVKMSGDVPTGLSDLTSEIHIYSINGDYVKSVYDNYVLFDSDINNAFIDIRSTFIIANILRGSYKIAVNILSPIFGRYTSNLNTLPVLIREMSPDRTEIKMSIRDSGHMLFLQQFREYVFDLSQNSLLNNLVVNFGQNRINRVLNIRFDSRDQSIFYVKLYTPVDVAIQELDSACFALEVTDPYIDTVILTSKLVDPPVNKLRGPKFDIDVDLIDSRSTMYKTWDELLNTNAQTTQRIIDLSISSSGQATLNLDYTDFKNFIFYSSAEERVKNFTYKMGMIESYSMDITNLSNSSNSGSIHISTSVLNNSSKISSIVTSFDPFERWLYYSPTSSLFTHDLSGSVTPWPKYQLNDTYIQHSATSSLVKNWYNSTVDVAKLYDIENQNSLWYSIPEHVLMDENNSNYIMFVQMVGQHFDVMYSYINALTDIHSKDEHPQRGSSPDLLQQIAKSFGWNLQNSRQLSDLWLYKMGTDQSGSIQYSSGLTVLPHEEQTKQIWKRIVNNLPYLLKTKGTSRSIKALMSIFGIPQTLLSIKEYGGPGIQGDVPILVEDAFTYKLNINSGSYLRVPQEFVSASWYGWGDGSWCSPPGPNNQIIVRQPDTYEFRFSTQQSGSTGLIPLFVQTSGSSTQVQTHISLISSVEFESEQLISGSDKYGRLLYESFGSSSQYYYSDYIPVFDGDMWTIRFYNETGPYVSGSSKLNRIQLSKASDCIGGKITKNVYISASLDSYDIDTCWITGGSGSSYIINNTQTSHSAVLDFEGSIQGYKEYYTLYDNNTFASHVRNPRAYHNDSVSGSFYSLYRYLPLGLDLQREDHTIVTFISSSQPDQKTYTPALTELVGFTGTQSTQYTTFNETHYIQVPTIGGTTVYSEKIRIESSSLTSDLAPDYRFERSGFDDSPVDTNRLAVVFSLSDQINRDIYNHMGFDVLDNWIADPEDEFKSSYPILNNKLNEYFQKYSQKNDINTFIRILSLYDYTFFEQIKQLVPGRADLIAGILIEPHILQRSKVQLSKQPKISNHYWKDNIRYEVSQSGKFPKFETDVQFDTHSDIKYFYKTGSIEFVEYAHIKYGYYTGEIEDPFYCHIKGELPVSGTLYVTDPYTSFTSGSVKKYRINPRLNPNYLKKKFIFDAYSVRDSGLSNSLFDGITGSVVNNWYVDTPTTIITNTTNPFANEDSRRFVHGIRLSSGQIMSQSINTDSNSEYLVRIYAGVQSSDSELQLYVNGSLIGTRSVKYLEQDNQPWIQEFRMYFTGSGTDVIEIQSNLSDLDVFSVESHVKLSAFQEGIVTKRNEIENKYEYFVLEPSSYQLNEASSANKNRYAGSKLVGAGINIDSKFTVDGGPVIVIKESNPNALFMGLTDSEGNLRVE